jgi:hypothetical protein
MDYETNVTALSQFRLTLTHPVSRYGFKTPAEIHLERLLVAGTEKLSI